VSRRETAYRLGVVGAIVVLLAIFSLWAGNPGLSRSQLILTDVILVILAFVFVFVAIAAHLRGGGR
jgi:hypothetical protein